VQVAISDLTDDGSKIDGWFGSGMDVKEPSAGHWQLGLVRVSSEANGEPLPEVREAPGPVRASSAS